MSAAQHTPGPVSYGDMSAFAYVCRSCGEGCFIPQSTVSCAWCGVSDPFGGDPGRCRPKIFPSPAAIAKATGQEGGSHG